MRSSVSTMANGYGRRTSLTECDGRHAERTRVPDPGRRQVCNRHMTGQDATRSDEPVAALAAGGGSTDRPTPDPSGGPASGGRDDHVLMLGDSTIPVPHRGPEPAAH